ncbi:unnamed protein product [Lathyrus oleraceus]
MFTRSRRFPSSSSSSKNSDDSISKKKVINAIKTQLTKKRPALAEVTNSTNASLVETSVGAPSKPMVPCVSKTAKTKTDSIASSKKNVMSKNTLQPPLRVKLGELVPAKEACLIKNSQTKSEVQAFIVPSNDGAVCPDTKRLV